MRYVCDLWKCSSVLPCNALMFLIENGNNFLNDFPVCFPVQMGNKYKDQAFQNKKEIKHNLHLHCNAIDKARSKLETRHTTNSHEYGTSYL